MLHVYLLMHCMNGMSPRQIPVVNKYPCILIFLHQSSYNYGLSDVEGFLELCQAWKDAQAGILCEVTMKWLGSSAGLILHPGPATRGPQEEMPDRWWAAI